MRDLPNSLSRMRDLAGPTTKKIMPQCAHMSLTRRSHKPRAMLPPIPEAPAGPDDGCRSALDALSELCHFIAPLIPEATEGLDDGCRGNALVALRELCDFIAGPETQSPTARLRKDEHAAAERQAPAFRDTQEWPAHRQVCGRLTLKASVDHSKAVRAVCSISGGVLSIRIASSKAVVAQVPVEELAVGLQTGHTQMFTVATFQKNRMHDEIYCFADDKVKFNQWIDVFRRMGVPVFDISDGTGNATELRR
jgi:hypothetical protein